MFLFLYRMVFFLVVVKPWTVIRSILLWLFSVNVIALPDWITNVSCMVEWILTCSQKIYWELQHLGKIILRKFLFWGLLDKKAAKMTGFYVGLKDNMFSVFATKLRHHKRLKLPQTIFFSWEKSFWIMWAKTT